MKEPASMEECIYFTNININSGKVKAWVSKEKCPKCGLGLMGKPVEKGKIKIRAKEYVCPECKYKIDKDELMQKKLEGLGVRFLRFTDEDVKKNIERVVMAIEEWIRRNPPLYPSREGI